MLSMKADPERWHQYSPRRLEERGRSCYTSSSAHRGLEIMKAELAKSLYLTVSHIRSKASRRQNLPGLHRTLTRLSTIPEQHSIPTLPRRGRFGPLSRCHLPCAVPG